MRRKDREVTDKKEIQRILETCKVCRIGLPEEDGVYIVPAGAVFPWLQGRKEDGDGAHKPCSGD